MIFDAFVFIVEFVSSIWFAICSHYLRFPTIIRSLTYVRDHIMLSITSFSSDCGCVISVTVTDASEIPTFVHHAWWLIASLWRKGRGVLSKYFKIFYHAHLLDQTIVIIFFLIDVTEPRDYFEWLVDMLAKCDSDLSFFHSSVNQNLCRLSLLTCAFHTQIWSTTCSGS